MSNPLSMQNFGVHLSHFTVFLLYTYYGMYLVVDTVYCNIGLSFSLFFHKMNKEKVGHEKREKGKKNFFAHSTTFFASSSPLQRVPTTT